MSRITLTDDGTMDTVLVCSECGEEARYNFSESPDDETTETDVDGPERYADFVDWAIEDFESEHECPEETERRFRED